jgi:hypothetical protein
MISKFGASNVPVNRTHAATPAAQRKSDGLTGK